jgi:hypothetical protein
MAVPLLAKEQPETYSKLLESRSKGQLRLSFLERRTFGWTHAEAAGVMARQWNLPDEFIDLIENHLDLDSWAGKAEAQPAKAAVSLSSLLPTTADPTWVECPRFEMIYEKMRTPGSLNVPELLAQIDEEFTEFAPVLKLGKPGKSLVESHQEMVQPAGSAVSNA